ncbi:MAG TPA: alpha/beta hydrolase family protein [Bryobacteraceae bacterium]|jgi:dienelactone hydrolase
MSTPKKMTRRDLAFTAALLAQAGGLKATPQDPAPAQPYTGPLEGFENKVRVEDFDPVAWTLARHETAPMRMTFKAANKKQAEAWQKSFHAKLTELVGGFPKDRVALGPQTLEVTDFPDYRRERFVIETRPGVMMLGVLLTPKLSGGPPKHGFPTVVCAPGHGRGVDDIIGVNREGKPESNPKNIYRDYALQVVRQGLAAVAIEMMAFGCRRDSRTKKEGLGASACQPTAGSALLLGETMVGWRVYDVMRTIDWIATRPELDSKRVGCLGLSGGGTCTLFSAALDPRIKVAYVSGYLNTFRDCIMSMSHCIDNYVPGILQWGEMYDVAALIAPRPLFVESGEHDPIFPLKGSLDSFAHVQRVYEVFGAKEHTQQEVFPGVHEFWGRQGLPFLKAKLESVKA